MEANAGRMRDAMRTHGRRGAAFLIVGVAGAVVDLAAFNALVYAGGHGPMFDQPVAAKVLATLLATAATYFGNARLTYRDRPVKFTTGRMAIYLMINVTAIGIQAGCLALSRYVFGLSGPVADNVSGPLIGQILATAFRYLAYPRLVFVSNTQTGSTTDEKRQHADSDRNHTMIDSGDGS